MTFNNEIEELKAQIKVLEKKVVFLDDYGRHWYARMEQKEEPWLTYTQKWELRTH